MNSEKKLKYDQISKQYIDIYRHIATQDILSKQNKEDRSLYKINHKLWQQKYSQTVDEYINSNIGTIATIALPKLKKSDIHFRNGMNYVINLHKYMTQQDRQERSKNDKYEKFFDEDESIILMEKASVNHNNGNRKNVKNTTLNYSYTDNNIYNIDPINLKKAFKNIYKKDKLMFYDLETLSGNDENGEQKLSQITDFTFSLSDSKGNIKKTYSSIVGSTQNQYEEYVNIINKIKKGQGFDSEYEKIIFYRLQKTGAAKLDKSQASKGIFSFSYFPGDDEIHGIDTDLALKGAKLMRDIGIKQQEAPLIEYNGYKMMAWEKELFSALDEIKKDSITVGGYNIQQFDNPILSETLMNNMHSEGANKYAKQKYKFGFKPKYVADALIAEKVWGKDKPITSKRAKIAKDINSTLRTQETLVRTMFDGYYDKHKAHTSDVDVKAGIDLMLKSGRYSLDAKSEKDSNKTIIPKEDPSNVKIEANNRTIFLTSKGIDPNRYGLIGFTEESFSGKLNSLNAPLSLNTRNKKTSQELFTQSGLQRGVAYYVQSIKEIKTNKKEQDKLKKLNKNLHNEKLYSITFLPALSNESQNLRKTTPITFIGAKNNISSMLNNLLLVAQKNQNEEWDMSNIPLNVLKQLDLYKVQDGNVTQKRTKRDKESVKRIIDYGTYNFLNEHAARERRSYNFARDKKILNILDAMNTYVSDHSDGLITEEERNQLRHNYISSELEKAVMYERKIIADPSKVNDKDRYNIFHQVLGFSKQYSLPDGTKSDVQKVYRNTVDKILNSLRYVETNKYAIQSAIDYIEQKFKNDPDTSIDIKQKYYESIMRSLEEAAEEKYGREAIGKKIDFDFGYEAQNKFEVDISEFEKKSYALDKNILSINLYDTDYKIADKLFLAQGINPKKVSDESKLKKIVNFQEFLINKGILQLNKKNDVILNAKDFSYESASSVLTQQIRQSRKYSMRTGLITDTLHHNVIDVNKPFLSNQEIDTVLSGLKDNEAKYYTMSSATENPSHSKLSVEKAVSDIIDNIVFQKIGDTPEKEIQEIQKRTGLSENTVKKIHEVRNIKRAETTEFLTTILSAVKSVGGSFAYNTNTKEVFVSDPKNATKFVKINNLLQDIVTDNGMMYERIGATETIAPYTIYEVGSNKTGIKALSGGTRIGMANSKVGWAKSAIHKAAKDDSSDVPTVIQRIIDTRNSYLRQTYANNKDDMQDIKTITWVDTKATWSYLYDMDNYGLFDHVKYDASNPNSKSSVLRKFLDERKQYDVDNMDHKVVNALHTYLPSILSSDNFYKYVSSRQAIVPDYFNLKPLNRSILSGLTPTSKKSIEGKYTYYDNPDALDNFGKDNRNIEDQLSRAKSFYVAPVQKQINNNELIDVKIGSPLSTESRYIQNKNNSKQINKTDTVIRSRILQLSDIDLHRLIEGTSELSDYTKNFLELASVRDNSAIMSPALTAYAFSDRDSLQMLSMEKVSDKDGIQINNAKKRISITPLLSVKDGKISFSYNSGIFVQQGEEIARVNGLQGSDSIKTAKYSGILKFGFVGQNNKIATNETIQAVINSSTKEEQDLIFNALSGIEENDLGEDNPAQKRFKIALDKKYDIPQYEQQNNLNDEFKEINNENTNKEISIKTNKQDKTVELIEQQSSTQAESSQKHEETIENANEQINDLKDNQEKDQKQNNKDLVKQKNDNITQNVDESNTIKPNNIKTINNVLHVDKYSGEEKNNINTKETYLKNNNNQVEDKKGKELSDFRKTQLTEKISKQMEAFQVLQNILERNGFKSYLYVKQVDSSGNNKTAINAEKNMAQVMAPSIGYINDKIKNVLTDLTNENPTVELGKTDKFEGKIVRRYGAQELLSLIVNRDVIDSLDEQDLSKSDFGIMLQGYAGGTLSHEKILDTIKKHGFKDATDFKNAIIEEQNSMWKEFNQHLRNIKVLGDKEEINIVSNTLQDDAKHQNFQTPINTYISNRLAQNDSLENRKKIAQELQPVLPGIYVNDNGQIVTPNQDDPNASIHYNQHELDKLVDKNFGIKDKDGNYTGKYTTDKTVYVDKDNKKTYSEDEYNQLSPEQQKALAKIQVESTYAPISALPNYDNPRMRAANDAFGKTAKLTDRNFENMKMHTFDQDILDITKERLIQNLGKKEGTRLYNQFYSNVEDGEYIGGEVIKNLESQRFKAPGENAIAMFDGHGKSIEFSTNEQDNKRMQYLGELAKKDLIENDNISKNDIDNIIDVARRNGARGVSANYIRNTYTAMKFAQAKQFNEDKNINVELANKRGFKTVSINKILTNPDVDKDLEDSIYSKNMLLDLHMDDLGKNHQMYRNEAERYIALPYLNTQYIADDYKVRSEFQQKMSGIVRDLQDFKQDYAEGKKTQKDIDDMYVNIQSRVGEVKDLIAEQLTKKKGIISQASEVFLDDSGIFTTQAMSLIGNETSGFLKGLNFEGINLVEQAAKVNASHGREGMDLAYAVASRQAYNRFYNEDYIKGLTQSLGMNLENTGQFREKLSQELSSGGTLSINSRDPQNYALSTNVNALYFSDMVHGDTLKVSNSLQQAMKNDNDSDKVMIKILKGRANISFTDSEGVTKTKTQDIDYATYKVLSGMKNVKVDLTEETQKLFRDAKRWMYVDSATVYPKYYSEDQNIPLSESKRTSSFDGKHLGEMNVSGTSDGEMSFASNKRYSDEEKSVLSNKYAHIENEFMQSQNEQSINEFNNSSAANQRRMIRDWAVDTYKDKDNTRYNEIQDALEYRLSVDKQEMRNDAHSTKLGAGAIDFQVHRMSTKARASGAFSGTELQDIMQIRTALTEQFLSPKNETGKPDLEYIDKVSGVFQQVFDASRSKNINAMKEAEKNLYDTLDNLLSGRYSKELSKLTPIIKRDKKGNALRDENGNLKFLEPQARIQRALHTYASIATKVDFSQTSDIADKVGTSQHGIKNSTKMAYYQDNDNQKQRVMQEVNMASQMSEGNKDIATALEGPKETDKTRHILHNSTPNLQKAIHESEQEYAPNYEEEKKIFQNMAKTQKTIGNFIDKTFGKRAGSFIAGLGGGILLSGYGSTPSSPAETQASDANNAYEQQYDQQQIPSLSDNNPYSSLNNPPAYNINISGDSGISQDKLSNIIGSAINSQIPSSTSINLQMNTSFGDKISQLQINRMVANSLFS